VAVPDRKRAEAIDDPSPARLYATLVGGLLVIFGVVGFFYSASFGTPGSVDEALGALRSTAGVNVLHVLAGALGLLVAGFAARRYALWLGVLFLALAGWGFILGGGDEAILGFLPVNTGNNLLHLALGLLGAGAALATPQPERAAGPPRKARPA